MTIFGTMLFASLILTACGEGSKSEDLQGKSKDLQSKSEDLKGKYFRQVTFVGSSSIYSIYFIDGSELLHNAEYQKNESDYYHYSTTLKLKYTIKGNELTVHNKLKDDPESKDTKFIIYNNEVLMNFDDDQNFFYPSGSCYRLSE